MEKILNGKWELCFFEQNSIAPSKPSKLSEMGAKFIPCTVPGNVELDLINGGYLPKDIFMGENICEAEKYETYEWWYRTTFCAAKPKGKDRLILHFEAVDCFAEYYLNDELIGTSSNMFVPAEFDISEKVVETENILYVRIRSAVLEANDIPVSLLSLNYRWKPNAGADYVADSLSVRKAPHCYGWDIMPRAVSAGIWKDVSLVTRKPAEFKQLYLLVTNIEKSFAEVRTVYELGIPQPYFGKKLYLKFTGRCGDSEFEEIHPIRFKAGNFSFIIQNPLLWYPYGYGEANIYDVEAVFLAEDEVLAEKKFTLGIRTVELERADGPDGCFRFIVNNEEIMVKGTNWVPLDVYHSRDVGRYDKALALVKDLGCNMLRCWGGNVYPDEKLYDFCDRNGIMVWQDFALACYSYPRSDEFAGLLKEEAEYVIKKFRQHPSLAIWCGDNECDVLMCQLNDPNVTNKASRKVLFEAVLNHDFARPYIASSPYVSEQVYGAVKNDYAELAPEDHLWGPRDYYKSVYYTNAQAKFVSETGYYGCPSVKSIKKFINADALWPCDNSEWNLHSSDQGNASDRIDLMKEQLVHLFGRYGESLEEFSILSQLSQAEAMKYFIEKIRIKRPETSGIIWWNMLDGWPQISDAVIDYYFCKKAAYYYIKNIQQPFCIFLDELKDGEQTIVASNDTLEEAMGWFAVTDAETQKVIYEGSFEMGRNQNKALGKIVSHHSEQRLLLIEWSVNGKNGANHYISGSPKYSAEQFLKWFDIICERVIHIDPKQF